MSEQERKFFYLDIKDYFRFIKSVYKRGRSISDYYNFQFIQGYFLIKYLNSKDINIENFTVLDLANGFAGETQALGEKCKVMVGLDLNIPPNGLNFPQIIGNANITPFQEEQFDLIICASLIEHISNPQVLLEEIFRILKTSGYIYISFPPFYSINGGHDFTPFHYFGKNFGVKLSKFFAKLLNRKRFGKPVIIQKDFETAFGNWGLYVMTIKKMRNLINNSNFQIIDQSTKWLPVNFSKMPFFGEFLTWHVQFILKKKIESQE